MSREESESVLEVWGGIAGYFLVRESGPAWVLSRVGISDEKEELVIHRKIFLTGNGKYMVQSTRTTAPEFATLDDLIYFYQQQTFSDGTKLTSEMPPNAECARAPSLKYIMASEQPAPTSTLGCADVCHTACGVSFSQIPASGAICRGTQRSRRSQALRQHGGGRYHLARCRWSSDSCPPQL